MRANQHQKNILPGVVSRQGNPIDDSDPTPYYLSCFSAWFHNHSNGTAGMLIQVRHRVLQCEHCTEQWGTNPDKDWVIRRAKRVDEVMTRLRPTDDPWVFQCPERSRHDGMVYRIEFDAGVHRWTCTCRDFCDFQSRFWGGCKHVRAVKKNIAMFIADHEQRGSILRRIDPSAEPTPTGGKADQPEVQTFSGFEPSGAQNTVARQLVRVDHPVVSREVQTFRRFESLCKREAETKAQEITPSLDDQLPVGRPIRGNGWRCTLLTKSKDGVTFLEVQGVIHQEAQDAVWEEFRQKKFEVNLDCVWIDIAHRMGSEVVA